MNAALALLVRHLPPSPWLSVGIAATALGLMLATSPAEAEDLPTYTLAIKAGHFRPETVEVPAHTKFRLEIRNEGPGPEEFESTELLKEKVLAAGVTGRLVFQPLKPGTYGFFGEFHPETARGQIVAK